MITVRTSPQYVNRVRQDWMANGGVYGDGGISALVPSNDPFAQLGPTLDLTFAGNPTDLLTASTTAGYTLDTYFTPETYQIAVPYAIWEDGVGLSQKTFAQIVTFTRASTATYFNSAGTLTSAAVDESRFDYDPSTLAPLGLLIEESRTNSIRNNTMVGAVAGTPGTLPTNWTILGSGLGTLTQQVVGTGTTNGINYIDYRVSGTTSTTGFTLSFEQSSQIVALNGQTWASSAWASLIGGSTTNINTLNLTIDGRTAAGAFVGVVNGLSLLGVTPTLTRYTSTGTIANASVERVVLGITLGFASGVAIDITLRIGLPQLELGAFATSVIPTTTTALTRSADVASVNTLSPWYSQPASTVYAEFAPAFQGSASAAANNPGVWGATQNSLGSFNGYGVRLVPNSSFSDTINGVSRYAPSGFNTQVSIGPSAFLNLGQTYKTAFAWDSSGIAGSRDGQAAVTSTNPAAAAMGAHDQMYLGRQNVGGTPTQLNGYLRRITYYPRRLSNADLQTITT
jgi:hypothetical protein